MSMHATFRFSSFWSISCIFKLLQYSSPNIIRFPLISQIWHSYSACKRDPKHLIVQTSISMKLQRGPSASNGPINCCKGTHVQHKQPVPDFDWLVVETIIQDLSYFGVSSNHYHRSRSMTALLPGMGWSPAVSALRSWTPLARHCNTWPGRLLEWQDHQLTKITIQPSCYVPSVFAAFCCHKVDLFHLRVLSLNSEIQFSLDKVPQSSKRYPKQKGFTKDLGRRNQARINMRPA